MHSVWEGAPYKGGDLLVLLALADQANSDGICWPSVASLATKTRMSERHVQKVIRRLQSDGALDIHDGGFVSGKNRANTYLVKTGWQKATPWPDGHHPPVTDAAPPVSPVPPQPSSEPSSEPSSTDGAAEPPALFDPPAEAPAPSSPAPADATNDDLVRRVWDHYVEVFGVDHMRIKELTPARATSIRKAIKATDVPSCCAAIDGLKSYRTKNPGGSRDISLGAIFETRPGGRNLTDQIEFWASQADVRMNASSSGVPLDLSGVSPVLRGQINARRMDVVRYHSAENPDTQRRIAEAIAWLREHAGHEPVIEDGDLKGWRFVVAD